MSLMSAVGNQFKLPRGRFGRIVAMVMGRMSRPGNAWAIDQVGPLPTDRVLDVGFGPGLSIAMLAERVPQGHVSGIDASEDMLAVASKRNRQAIADGRVDLQLGDAFALPFEVNSFDEACTVNTVYLFEDPGGMFRELHRVLTPGGRAVIAFPDADEFRGLRPTRSADFHIHAVEDVLAMTRGAGFTDVTLLREQGIKLGGQAIVGTA